MRNIFLFFALLGFLTSCKREETQPNATIAVSEKNGKWAIHNTVDSALYIYDRVYISWADQSMESTTTDHAIRDNKSIDITQRYTFMTEVIDPVSWESKYGFVVNDTVLCAPGEFDSYELVTDTLLKVMKDGLYTIFDLHKNIIVPAGKVLPEYKHLSSTDLFFVQSPEGSKLYLSNGKAYGPYDDIDYVDDCVIWKNWKKGTLIAGLFDQITGKSFSISDNDDVTFDRYLSSHYYEVYAQKTKMRGIVNDEGNIVVPITHVRVSDNGTRNLICPIDSNTIVYLENESLVYYTLNDGVRHTTDTHITDIDPYYHNGILTISLDDKYGAFEFSHAKIIIPMEFSSVDVLDSTIECHKSTEPHKYGKYDFNGNFLGFGYSE